MQSHERIGYTGREAGRLGHIRRLVMLTIAIAWTAPASGQTAQSVLTNADVVSLVKRGVSDTAIVLIIEGGETNFDLSSQAIADLKNNRVSDTLIVAILTANAKRATAKPNVAQPYRME